MFSDPDMMKMVMDMKESALYERLIRKKIFDPESGVVQEAMSETYVKNFYAKPVE